MNYYDSIGFVLQVNFRERFLNFTKNPIIRLFTAWKQDTHHNHITAVDRFEILYLVLYTKRILKIIEHGNHALFCILIVYSSKQMCFINNQLNNDTLDVLYALYVHFKPDRQLPTLKQLRNIIVIFRRFKYHHLGLYVK